MTRRRWIADEVAGNTAALTGDHATHLSRVLRAQVGQEFDISIKGGVRRGTVTSVSDDRVEFALGQELPAKLGPQLTLVLSIFKFDRMEWAIEKCTEIGVARIVPLMARRTDPHLASAAVKRRERWARIALQASEQSRRTKTLDVTAPAQLSQVQAVLVAGGAPALPLLIVLAESGEHTMLRDVIEASQYPSNPPHLILAIGPEGGWTDGELHWFRESGWSFASLGDTILRAETAAIVAAAIALDCLR